VSVAGPGEFVEILNTDAESYWGSNAGNQGSVEAQPVSHLGWPYSIRLTLPPLAAMYFKRKTSLYGNTP
jgi:1,4-alpha-glucan branching enzyme